MFERRVLSVWNTVLRRSRFFPAGLSGAELCFVWWTDMWTEGSHFSALSVRKTPGEGMGGRGVVGEGTNTLRCVQGSSDLAERGEVLS